MLSNLRVATDLSLCQRGSGRRQCWRTVVVVVVVVVVVEILFCIADKTGYGEQYYDGDKVTAKSQGYNKQAYSSLLWTTDK